MTAMRPGRRTPPESTETFDRGLLLPMVLSSILNPINSSIIAIAMVPIGVAFGAPPSRTAWLVSALYLANAIGQPITGRLVDIFGARRLYFAGAGLTCVAGLIGTLAPNLPVLIVARALLGLGTCAAYPASMYLIQSESRRTGHDSPAMVLTIIAVANQTVVVVGPPLGGALIELGGWRSTFAINIVLALASVVFGLRRIPRSGPDRTRRLNLDPLGLALFTIAVPSLLLFSMTPRTHHLWLLVVSGCAAVAFVAWELRAAEPFIDIRMLRDNVPLLFTYARAVVITLILYSFLFGFGQWLEDGRGLSPSRAGLILLALSASAVIVAAATGRSRQVRAKLIIAQGVQVLGCGALVALNGTTPIWVLVALACLLGVPQGLGTLALQFAVYHQAEPERIGASAGILRTCISLGAIAAATANGALFGGTAGSSGLHSLGVFTCAVGVVGVLGTVFDYSLGRLGRNEADARTTATSSIEERTSTAERSVVAGATTSDGPRTV